MNPFKLLLLAALGASVLLTTAPAAPVDA